MAWKFYESDGSLIGGTGRGWHIYGPDGSIIGGGGTPGSLEVAEIDGNPDVSDVTRIEVTNGTLTDNGGGQVTLTIGGGSNHDMLDGSVHQDSVADAVSQGSLIYGNATPKWDELVIGSEGQVLASISGVPAWSNSWTLVEARNPITGANVQDFNGLTAYSEVLVIARAITFGSNDNFAIRVSTDNGSSFFTTSGDYQDLGQAGTENASTGVGFHSTAATAARTGHIHIFPFNISSAVKMIIRSAITPGTSVSTGSLFVASSTALNAIRVYSTGANNFTAGTIYVFGKR